MLNGMSLIDTPGVLSGEKQRIKRGYEFEEVVKLGRFFWFLNIYLLLFFSCCCSCFLGFCFELVVSFLLNFS